MNRSVTSLPPFPADLPRLSQSTSSSSCDSPMLLLSLSSAQLPAYWYQCLPKTWTHYSCAHLYNYSAVACNSWFKGIFWQIINCSLCTLTPTFQLLHNTYFRQEICFFSVEDLHTSFPLDRLGTKRASNPQAMLRQRNYIIMFIYFFKSSSFTALFKCLLLQTSVGWHSKNLQQP